MEIEGTNLIVTKVLLNLSQTCLWREEQVQELIILEVKDKTTEETGTLLMEWETDKRDINHEEFYTNNTALFPEVPSRLDLEYAFSNAQQWLIVTSKTPEYTEVGDIPLEDMWDHEVEYKV